MDKRSASPSPSPHASARSSRGTDDSLPWIPPPPPVDPNPGWADICGDVADEGYTGYNQTKVDVVAVPCPGADPVESWARCPFPEDYFHPTRPGLAGPGLPLPSPAPAPPPSRQNQRQHVHFWPSNAAGTKTDNNRVSVVEKLAGHVPLSPGINRPLPRAEYHWVRQGIRSAAPTARVLLYRHRTLSEGVTLDMLAQDLLDQLQQLRRHQRGPGQQRQRPLFFIAHGIGGLVVKYALLRASEAAGSEGCASSNHKNEDSSSNSNSSSDISAKEILFGCHGVAFFGTPHRGSSYMTMLALRESIQGLLHLYTPLPWSLAGEVTLNNRTLLNMHDRFLEIASELSIWTFYETLESQLYKARSPRDPYSSGAELLPHETQFGAPLVSIKSTLVNVRHEKVMALDEDHAHLASFGKDNLETMICFLQDLAASITKAQRLSDKYTHTPLDLLQQVKVDLVGFHANPNPDPPASSSLWLYSSRISLDEFLHKGPEQCLYERLSTGVRRGRPNPARRRRETATPLGGDQLTGDDGGYEHTKAGIVAKPERDESDTGLGIQHPAVAAVGIDRGSEVADMSAGSPGIVVTTPSAMTKAPPLEEGGLSPTEAATASPAYSSSLLPTSPTPVPDLPNPRPRHSLTVPALRTPDYSHPSQRRRSNETMLRSGSDPLIRGKKGESEDVAVTDDEGDDDDDDDDSPTTRQQPNPTQPPYRQSSSASDPVSTAATAHLLPGRVISNSSIKTSSAARDGRPLVGFSRPISSLRRFAWVHVPFNNPVWAKAILKRIGEARGQTLTRLFADEHWVSHGLGRHAQSHASCFTAGCKYVPGTAAAAARLGAPAPAAAVGSPQLSPHSGGNASPAVTVPASPSLSSPPPSPPTGTSDGDASYLYLHMPFLHFDTYRAMVRRRMLVERRLRHGRARPVPADVAALESLELRVLWQYLGSDPPVNGRRTLDQFGKPSMRDSYARDDDQMLYKLTKERGGRSGSGRARAPTPRPVPGGDGAGAAGGKKAKTSTTKVTWSLGEDILPARNSPSPAAGESRRRTSGLAALRQSLMEWNAGTSKAGDGKGGGDQRNADMGVESLRDGKVLMVDQLWMWEMDDNALVTFFPKRESSPKEGTLFQQADLRNSVYQELSGDLTGVTENALDLAAFVVLHAVTVLIDRSSHPDLAIFRLFEEAVGLLEERIIEHLKRKQLRASRVANGSRGGGRGGQSGDGPSSTGLYSSSSSDDNVDDNDHNDDYGGDIGIDIDLDDDSSDDGLDEGDNSTAAIRKRHRRELVKTERETRDNASAMLELRDMEDELRTLSRLFVAQETAVVAMRGHFTTHADLHRRTRNGCMFLDEALHRLGEYREWTESMLGRVDMARTDYEKMLEMMQRQVQVDDVHWSRLQTELASSQNLAVTIFTTFTVIFLPLSFFVSVFGMNAREWQGTGVPTLAEIGAIALPASMALIALTLIAGFSAHAQAAIRSTYHMLVFVVALVVPGAVSDRRAAVQRRRRRRRHLHAERLRRKKAERERAERARQRHRERHMAEGGGVGGVGVMEGMRGLGGGGAGAARDDRYEAGVVVEGRYDFWADVRGRLSRRRHYEIPDVNRLESPTPAMEPAKTWWGKPSLG